MGYKCLATWAILADGVGLWPVSEALTHADVHGIANDLSHTNKKFIGKGNTFIWESYVHNFEQFLRG